MRKELVLAIDFDGTIVELAYPKVGEMKPEADIYINKLYDEGHHILIHTCRCGEHEQDAKEFLESKGIKFHELNNNIPHLIEMYANDSRKLSADIYIDDKCLMGIPDTWKEIYDIIQIKAKNHALQYEKKVNKFKLKKQFRLPKEFAEKWLTALRSGEYQQGEETLIQIDGNECSYCCLGVAGRIAGFEKDVLETESMLVEKVFKSLSLPDELIETDNEKLDSFIYILASLNDGLCKTGYNQKIKNKNLIFREINLYENDFDRVRFIKFNFNQIADFIEDNCEFYEEETIKN